MWKIFNAASEDFLDTVVGNKHYARGSRGRGRPPKFVWQTVAATVKDVDFGAATAGDDAFRKLKN